MAKKKGVPAELDESAGVKRKTKTTTRRKTKPKQRRRRIAKSMTKWTFPKHSLEEALRVARAIEDKNAGLPMRADDLVIAVGFNKPNDWRFLDLVRSSNQYGLTTGSGERATVSLQPTGNDIVAPSSPVQRQKALVEAFRNVEAFRKVEVH